MPGGLRRSTGRIDGVPSTLSLALWRRRFRFGSVDESFDVQEAREITVSTHDGDLQREAGTTIEAAPGNRCLVEQQRLEYLEASSRTSMHRLQIDRGR